MGGIPFWSGKDSKLKFFFEDKSLVVDNMEWRVKREGVEAADGVCGEDRDRLQTITNYFSMTVTGKQQKLDAIVAFIEEQTRLDDRVLPKEKAVGILIFPADGTQAAFQCREYTLGLWEFGAKGRTERNDLSVPGRCRYFDSLQTL